MTARAGVCCLVACLLVHAADQVTDTITALIYFAQGLIFESCATLVLVYVPGLVVFLLEARQSLLGRGNMLKGILYLLVCPVYTWIIILYSIHHTEWREKAMFLVILEGFLTSSPQLVLQLSLWFKGVLTTPAVAVLTALNTNITSSLTGVTIITDTNYTNSLNVIPSEFEFLGRRYEEDASYMFGIVQLLSIVVSFVSVLTSGIFFNELERRLDFKESIYRKCISVPFFITTILYRSLAISLVICFLGWWSSVILFIFFFFTVEISVCAGDRFVRACMYGLWSQLLPVGFSRDPLESLGYKVFQPLATDEQSEHQSSGAFLKQRAKYFLNSHLLVSTVFLLPSMIISTVLVNQAKVYSWIDVSTAFIFDLAWLNMFIVPGAGLMLATSLVLGRAYQTFVYNDFNRRGI